VRWVKDFEDADEGPVNRFRAIEARDGWSGVATVSGSLTGCIELVSVETVSELIGRC
jgi:hypothetical protein